MFAGIQGGYHLFLTAQASGQKATDNACAAKLPYEAAEDAKYELGGWRVVLDEKLVREIYGQDVRLITEVLDCDGVYAYEERWVTVLAPE